MTEPVKLPKVRRLAALERLLKLLDERYRNGWAVSADVLAAMNAVDDGKRGDRDR